MEPRRFPLPHDIQYVLDGACEFGELDSGAYTALRLYGDSKVIDDILERERPAGSYRRRVTRIAEVQAYGLSLIEQLSEARRTILVLDGMIWLCHQVDDKARWLAHSNFEDETKGGSNLPFRDRCRLTHDHRPTPRVARRLESPKAIRRYIRREAEIGHLRALLRGLLRVQIAPRRFADSERQALIADQERQFLAQREAIRAHAGIVDRRVSRDRRKGRRPVIRAAAFAAALFGASQVSAFAKGDPVMIEGETVTISARLAKAVDTTGHGALRVEVLDHGGQKLAGLCIYQDDTPVLDQLAALKLHIEAGEEAVILSKGNLLDITAAGAAHPTISSRIKVRATGRADGLIPHSAWDARFKRHQDEYALRMVPVYREAIGAAVFGRGFGKIRALVVKEGSAA